MRILCSLALVALFALRGIADLRPADGGNAAVSKNPRLIRRVLGQTSFTTHQASFNPSRVSPRVANKKLQGSRLQQRPLEQRAGALAAKSNIRAGLERAWAGHDVTPHSLSKTHGFDPKVTYCVRHSLLLGRPR